MTLFNIAEQIFGMISNLEFVQGDHFRIRIKREFEQLDERKEVNNELDAFLAELGINSGSPSKRSTSLGRLINIVPVNNKGKCREQAVFVSKIHNQNPSKIALGEPMAFGPLLERLVQHLQGSCYGVTREVLVVTDNLDALAMNAWANNLQVAQHEQHVSIQVVYLDKNNTAHSLNDMLGIGRLL